MKKIALIIIGIFVLSGCGPGSIQLEMTSETWDRMGSDGVDTYLHTLVPGEEFEPESYLLSGWDQEPLFQVKKIIDEASVKISFDEESVMVVGDSYADPEHKSPLIITTEQTCFVTRTMDAGSTICLRVLE